MAIDSVRSGDSSGTPIFGLRSEIYERVQGITWMTKDDIETFETRIRDKALFYDIALVLLSASVPLGIVKFLEYRGSETPNPVALAILVVCALCTMLGIASLTISLRRRHSVESFKTNLFKEERRLATTFSMIDPSGSLNRNVDTTNA